jgi:pimeloyl-ACP methyl ester carboxylesterase
MSTLGSYLLCAATLALSPFYGRRAVKTPGKTPGLPPLILIHGIYNGAAAWLYLSRRFAEAGFPVSTCSYRSFFTSPDRILRGIEEHVRAVETAFSGVKPVFVCHSMGGLLIRHWLLSPGNKERTGGVLTLGTPHLGSKLAALGSGSLVKDLMPSAGFIRELQDAPELTPLPCVSLVSPTDEAVLPASCLLPPTGWRMRVTNRVGHFSMLFCPGVARIAMEELGEIIRKDPRGQP